METTGDRIRTCRREKGLTQGELGNMVGLSATAIMRYEKNTREPKAQAFRNIASVLGVSEEYLLCQTDDPTPQNNMKPSQSAQPEANSAFYQRGMQLFQSLKNEGKYQPEFDQYYEKLLVGNLSLSEKIAIANMFGFLCNVTIDYLFGYTDNPHGHLSSIPPEYSEIAQGIVDADKELLDAVHRICGMHDDLLASDIITESIYSVWNPQKIRIVKDFLINSERAIDAFLYVHLHDRNNGDK